ncbi:hypothetical protein F4823DRAFT_169354 [Ustulina deusta]|nr:hypothetical protein F4823DRAFT_169354 [Ustulina deusta]
MDPVTALGAAGSVVGIAGFGIQLSQILHKYLSQIWFAQESLEAVVEEIWLTTTALEEIYIFLKQEVVNINRGQPLYLFTENSLEKVKVTADKCLVIFWRVEATISGNWPERIEEQLIKRLIEFNNKLDQYTPDSPIKIESELTSDPLGLRDKLRWPSKASKLDKYCKQLQRYQDSLVLLLQVVSLGQQRLKPNPTEEDARLMLKTYAIINRIASPEKLRIIALETQTQSQSRHGNAGREPSVAPGHTKRPQTPSRAAANNLRITRVSTNSEPHTFGIVRTKNPSVSYPIPMDTLRSTSSVSSSEAAGTLLGLNRRHNATGR